MSHEPTTTQPAPVTPSVGDHAALQATLLEQLQPVLDAHGTSRNFFGTLFKLCLEHSRPLIGSIDVRIQAEVASGLHIDSSVATEADRADAKDQLEAFTTQVLLDDEGKPLGKPTKIAGRDAFLLGAPLIDVQSGELRGAVVVGIASDSKEQAQAMLADVNAMAAIAMSLDETNREQPTPTTEETWQHALQKAGDFNSATELAFALANSVCNRFDCEQVGFGIVKHKKIRILAISGLPTFKANSPGVVDMRGAMDECQDIRRATVYQMSGELDLSDDLPLHRQWSKSAGDTPVCSLPLVVGDDVIGVVSLRRSSGKTFTKNDVERIENDIAPFAQSLQLLHAAKRTLKEHVHDAWRTSSRNCFQPKSLSRKLVMVAVAASLLWFVFGFMPYKPMCKAQLTPAELRHVSAPFEAQLESVLIHAGDDVKAGQPLVEFATHSLDLELSALEAEIAASNVDVRQALLNNDAELAALANAKITMLAAKADLARTRIQQSVITAPADGTIIQCDVHQRVGAMLAQGEPILQFAPRSGWNIEIEVSDAVAPFVEAEQTGYFATTSRPGQKFPFRIRHVEGTAQTIEGSNVFIAEAPVEGDREWMRAGMQGTAQVRTQWKPVWWVALHSVIDGLRLKFWM